jgi:hypothetical protein
MNMTPIRMKPLGPVANTTTTGTSGITTQGICNFARVHVGSIRNSSVPEKAAIAAAYDSSMRRFLELHNMHVVGQAFAPEYLEAARIRRECELAVYTAFHANSTPALLVSEVDSAAAAAAAIGAATAQANKEAAEAKMDIATLKAEILKMTASLKADKHGFRNKLDEIEATIEYLAAEVGARMPVQ